MVDRRVWYVAYGSNLSEARFQRYLDRCVDPSRPADARPLVLPHELYFAHESSVWTGGTAFVDPVDGDAATRTVAWLIGEDQFLHVLASENGRSVGDVVTTDLPSDPGQAVTVLPGRYGLVLAVESPDQRRAFTFTNGEVPRPRPTRPGPDYVATIVAGLMDHHALTEAEARAYLARRGGSVELGLVPDPGEEIAERLERDTVLQQHADVSTESEIAGDEGVEGGARP